MYDPIVAEVHKVRDAHSKKFNYNVNAIFEDYNKRHDAIMARFQKIKNEFNKPQQGTANRRPCACSPKR